MKRIMAGLILVFAVLMLSSQGNLAQAEGKIAKNQHIKIKIKKDKNVSDSEVFDLDIKIKNQDGEPVVEGPGWVEEPQTNVLPSGLMMSVHFENPCRVCFGSPPRCYIKQNC